MEDNQKRDNYWNFSGVNDITLDLRKVKPVLTWRRGDKTLLEWLALESSDNDGDNDGDN